MGYQSEFGQFGIKAVHGKIRLEQKQLIPFGKEGAEQQVNEFIGAIAGNNRIHIYMIARRKSRAQRLCRRIRIAVERSILQLSLIHILRR